MNPPNTKPYQLPADATWFGKLPTTLKTSMAN